jgi:hypothetical protein
MNATETTCPYLKQVVMMYCDACPAKKMVPLDQLVAGGPCLTPTFEDCALYRDVLIRLGTDVPDAAPHSETESRREVFP